MSKAAIVDGIAPLTNVANMYGTLKSVMERPEHARGMMGFYGLPGLGKTKAAAFVANALDCYHVECQSAWTRGALIEAILKDMGLAPKPKLYQMIYQVSEELMRTDRPLIIDEMDYIVQKKMVGVIRDIFDGSQGATILMIGEENFDMKLMRWPRFHSRMCEWVKAEKASISDITHLADLYCDKVKVGKDLLKMLLKTNDGNARRIVHNLYRIQQAALEEGLDTMSLDDWKQTGKTLHTAQMRKVA